MAPPFAAHSPSSCARLTPYVSALSAARWRPASSVSFTEYPASGARLNWRSLVTWPSASTRTSLIPGVPRRFRS